MSHQQFWADAAWIGDQPVEHVVLDVEQGKIVAIDTNVVDKDPAMIHLHGLTLPGMANCHTHTFHRALRGALGTGTDFWTWRDTMYRVAERLTPETYYEFAHAAYTEMALAGYTTVAEFHYLHATAGEMLPSNAFGLALKEAAAAVGIRLTLLDTCYLSSGFGAPVQGAQRQFTDGTAAAWRDRVDQLEPTDHFRVGAAIHSVRAVTPPDMRIVAEWANAQNAPLHVHFSEQQKEVDACLQATGLRPTALLEQADAWGPNTVGIHGVHVTAADIQVLAKHGASVCVCPTTEADLADGIAPFGDYKAAGVPLVIGSDENVQTDPFGELRMIDQGERLRTGERHHFASTDLVRAGTKAGQHAAGWAEAGELAVGAPADFITAATDDVRMAGVALSRIPEFLTAADVEHVYVGGTEIVRDRHSAAGKAASTLHALTRSLRSES